MRLAAKRSDPNRSADRRANDRYRRSITWATCPARGAISSTCSPTTSPRPRSRHIVRFQVDQRARRAAYLARILWLQGLPDQAMRAAERSVDGRSGDQSRDLAVSRSRRGGMPDRAVGRRSGRGRTLRRNAARPFDKACAGALARLWPLLPGNARHPARRCRRPDCGCCAPAFDEPGATGLAPRV